MADYTKLTEELKWALVGAGYRQLSTNLPGFSLFHRSADGQGLGILLAEMQGCTELTREQFAQIHKRAYEALAAMGMPLIFLTVAADVQVGNRREFFAGIPACWLWELDTGRLLIYENQPASFYGVEKLIEAISARAEEAKAGSRENWDSRERRYADPPRGRGGGWNFASARARWEGLWRSRAVMNTLMVIINIAVFIVMEFMGNTEDARFMLTHGAAFAPLIRDYGQYYRLFTSMFLHFGLAHLLNNMFVLFLLGDNLERAVGKWKYVVIYLLSGIGGNVLSLWQEQMSGDYAVSAGASGAIFGVVGALFYVVAVNKGRLEDMTTRKLGLLIILTLYHGFTSTGVDNFAHIGGLLTGLLAAVILYRRPAGDARQFHSENF